jgi:hypothetical protein
MNKKQLRCLAAQISYFLGRIISILKEAYTKFCLLSHIFIFYVHQGD